MHLNVLLRINRKLTITEFNVVLKVTSMPMLLRTFMHLTRKEAISHNGQPNVFLTMFGQRNIIFPFLIKRIRKIAL